MMAIYMKLMRVFLPILSIFGSLAENKGTQFQSIGEDGPMEPSWGSLYLQLITRLENKYMDLEATLEDLRRKEPSTHAGHSVAFMAQLSAHMVKPTVGRVVVFDDVITNTGAAYDHTCGTFTAPVNGTYHFDLIASSPTASGSLQLIIVKNQLRVGYVFLDGNPSYWLRRSGTSTLHLTVGDKVKVQLLGTSSRTLAGATPTGHSFHTHFSGFLIQSD